MVIFNSYFDITRGYIFCDFSLVAEKLNHGRDHEARVATAFAVSHLRGMDQNCLSKRQNCAYFCF